MVFFRFISYVFLIYAMISSAYIVYDEWYRFHTVFLFINIINIFVFFTFYIMIPSVFVFILRDGGMNSMFLELIFILIYVVFASFMQSQLSGVRDLQFGADFYIKDGVAMPIYYWDRLWQVLSTYFVSYALFRGAMFISARGEGNGR